MFKKCTALAAVLFIFVQMMLLPGCGTVGTQQTQQQEEQAGYRILFVTDDIDAGFSSLAWELLRQEAELDGVQVTLLEVQGQADKASAALNQASEGLYDTVVLDRLAGETATEWVSRNAGYYPSVHYLCLDVALGESTNFDNVTYAEWDDTDLYYLFGVIAALNSGTGTVAFLGGENDVRSDNRYTAFCDGVSSQRSDVQALYYSLGAEPADDDTAMAAQQALQAGSDVLCTQIGAHVTAIDSVLHDSEKEVDLLVGGAEPAQIASFGGDVQLLASFSFKTWAVLQRLMEQCCEQRMPHGVYALNWENGSLTLQRTARYPGSLNENDIERCRKVEQAAREGVISPVLAADADPELLQNRILIGESVRN